MGLETAPGQRGTTVPSATFWRRRVVALAIGIGLVSLLVWAANGVLGSGRQPGRGSSGGGGGRHGGTSRPGTGALSASRDGSSASASATPRAAGGSGRSARLSHAGAAPGGHLATCPPGAVVLSLFSARAWYQAGQSPQFTVDVVSTADGACAFDVGARHVFVVVTAGRERIWDSADCVRGAGSHAVALTRGVPWSIHLTWDRRASSPGCRSPHGLASSGSYAAAAVAGAVRSRAILVGLRAKGASAG